jgi:O-antigen/teichoic acid export membrane protein
VDGLFAIASLVFAVSIARASTVDEFGSFAFAMTVYLFANGIIRATITETTLSAIPNRGVLRDGFQRAVLVSFVTSVVFLIVGSLWSMPFIFVLGLCLPGIIALDYVRLTNALINDPRIAIALGMVWAAAVLALGLAVFFIPVPAISAFAFWGATGALMGIVAAVHGGLPWMPAWRRDARGTRNAIWFGADYIAGSGGSLLTTALLGGVFGPTILAALRGAGTILGPANLLSTTTRSLSLPYLTRARLLGPRHEFRRAVVAATVSMSFVAPLLVVMVLIPPHIGTALLGQTWAVAAQVLIPLSLESLLSLGGGVAAAGHRSRQAGSHSFFLRLFPAIARPIVIIYFAIQGGIQGAAWAMAGLALVNLVIWWTSYFIMCQRAPRTDITKN